MFNKKTLQELQFTILNTLCRSNINVHKSALGASSLCAHSDHVSSMTTAVLIICCLEMQHLKPISPTRNRVQAKPQGPTLTNVTPSSSGMRTDDSFQSNRRTRYPHFLRPSARRLPMYPAPPVIKWVSGRRLWSPLPLRVTTIMNVYQETTVL